MNMSHGLSARSREVEETQVRSTSKGKDSEKVAEARIQNTGSSWALKERRGTLTIAIGGEEGISRYGYLLMES